MEFRLLQYFLAIAREETILKAAESLNVTQPTLSRQMKELEDHLGKQLFIRGNRKITLTEEGILLRQRAEEIVSLVEKTESEIMLFDETLSGEVCIGSGETLGIEIICKAIQRVQEDYPRIQFHLFSGNEQDVTDRLEKGLIDFGMIIEPANIYKYNHLSLPYQNLWGIYIKKDHPLALKATIAPQDLMNVPLLCSSQELKYKQIENWANSYFSKYHIIATYNLIYNASILTKECNGAVISLKNLIDTSNESSLCFRPLEPQISLWLIRCNKSGERKSTIQTETTVWSRNIVETQDFCYNGCRTLDDGKRDGKPMNISYQPLWNTLKERGMRKEDLRLAAGLTTNMIANMGKGEHISMKTLLRICEALNCGILDVIELTQDEEN